MPKTPKDERLPVQVTLDVHWQIRQLAARRKQRDCRYGDVVADAIQREWKRLRMGPLKEPKAA